MALSRLHIFISGLDDPCTVDKNTWFVTIYTCDGEILEFNNRSYALIPAPYGYLEVDVPPGNYYIKAVWWYTQAFQGVYRANHFTDAAVVTITVKEDHFVKLFNPSAYRCGSIYSKAIKDLVNQKLINVQSFHELERISTKLLDQIGRPVRLFELGHEAEIEKAVRNYQQKENS